MAKPMGNQKKTSLQLVSNMIIIILILCQSFGNIFSQNDQSRNYSNKGSIKQEPFFLKKEKACSKK